MRDIGAARRREMEGGREGGREREGGVREREEKEREREEIGGERKSEREI